MATKINTIVYIGRFQPLHNAHLDTMLKALEMADHLTIVIGSANQPRDDENPFTQDERQAMISRSLIDAQVDLNKVSFVQVENTIYNNTEWALTVDKLVRKITPVGDVKLIGHNKDETSFYLKMFPQWGKPIEVPMIEILDATTIRNMYFTPKHNMNFFLNVLPPAIVQFLDSFKSSSEYSYICDGAEYIRNYRKPHELLPYPPIFMTGDAVVIKGSHVLMVTRGKHPGMGLKAFPGGFMNAAKKVMNNGKIRAADANVLETAIRELFEETKIDLPIKMIRGCVKEEKLFDAVNRSRRGRVITMAQLIILPDDGMPLPKVKAADDAAHADWYLISDVMRAETFEDHYDILQYFRGRMSAYQN